MDAKEDQDAPDLLESNELIRHIATPENLVNAIDDDPIRTKDSFKKLFEVWGSFLTGSNLGEIQ